MRTMRAMHMQAFKRDPQRARIIPCVFHFFLTCLACRFGVSCAESAQRRLLKNLILEEKGWTKIQAHAAANRPWPASDVRKHNTQSDISISHTYAVLVKIRAIFIFWREKDRNFM
jgi:hypothetical protein